MKYLKSVFFLFFLALLIFSVSAEGTHDLVYNIEGNFVENSEHNFSFLNETAVENASLVLIGPKGDKNEFNLTSEDQTLQKNVEDSYFNSSGVYNFKFELDNQRLPKKGYNAFVIGTGNLTWEERFSGNARGLPEEDPYCSEEGNFTCEYEHFQASMMLKNYQGYRLTGEDRFLDEALNFSLKEYGSDDFSRLTCDPKEEVFDCRSDDSGAFDVSGAERQGSLIHALWSVYSMSSNDSVRELAVNYTEGSPEECNVWDSDFDCGNGSNQGHMAQGFWKAYEVSGNEKYKEIGEELLDTNYSDPRVTAATADAYRLTENKSYKQSLEDRFKQNMDRCFEQDCGFVQNIETINTGFKGFLATSNNNYYRHSVLQAEEVEQNCWKDSSEDCSYPHEQGVTSVGLGNVYASYEDVEKKFYNHRIMETPSYNQSLKAEISIQGLIESPEVIIRNTEGEELHICSLDEINSDCTIDDLWQEQGIYYMEFDSKEDNYPDSKGIPVAYSQKNDQLEADAKNIVSANPENRCEPWNDDYSCVRSDERDQAKYTSAFSKINSLYQNSSYEENVKGLATSPMSIEDLDEDSSLCVVDIDNFNCDTFDGVNAAEKQGSFINAMFNAFSATENTSFYDYGVNYAESSVLDSDECDVWQDQFNCETSDSQAEMISGYWIAYQTTGDERYREIAVNLSEEASNYENTSKLAQSIWKTYIWTGKEHDKEKATNMTENVLNNTDCPECGLEEFNSLNNLLVTAYRVSGDNYFQDRLENYLEHREEFECISEGSCEEPRMQGETITMMSRSVDTLSANITVDTELSVSETSLYVGESVEATCSVENLMENNTLTDITGQVYTQGEVLENKTENFSEDELEPGNKSKFTYEFESIDVGEGEINCDISSPEFDREHQTLIAVEEEDEEDEDEDDSSDSISSPTSGTIDQEEDDEEFEPYSEAYEFENQTYDWKNLNLSEKYEFKNLYLRENCISANRTFYTNYSELNINQDCYNEIEIFVIDILPENISENYRTHNFHQSNEETENIVYNHDYVSANWSAPTIVFIEDREITVEHISESNYTSDSEYHIAEFEVSQPINCELYHNDELVDTYSSEVIRANLTLIEGENTMKLDCGNHTKSSSVSFQETEQEDDLNTILPIGVFLMFISTLAILKLGNIKSYTHNLLFDFYFTRFKDSIQKGNVLKSVKYYKKMSTHYTDKSISEKILDSDLNLLRGVRMYIMSDILSQSDNLDKNVENKIRLSINNYLSNNKDSEVAREIKKNLKK